METIRFLSISISCVTGHNKGILLLGVNLREIRQRDSTRVSKLACSLQAEQILVAERARLGNLLLPVFAFIELRAANKLASKLATLLLLQPTWIEIELRDAQGGTKGTQRKGNRVKVLDRDR